MKDLLKWSTLYLILGVISMGAGMIKDSDTLEIIGLATFFYSLSLDRIEKLEDQLKK